jgi:hypothetical protein
MRKGEATVVAIVVSIVMLAILTPLALLAWFEDSGLVHVERCPGCNAGSTRSYCCD